MKLPRGAFVLPCGEEAISLEIEPPGRVVLQVWALSVITGEWFRLPFRRTDPGLTPSATRKLVRRLVAAAEKAAAWKRAAKLVRAR